MSNTQNHPAICHHGEKSHNGITGKFFAVTVGISVSATTCALLLIAILILL